jgi:hypothetical protein
VRYYLERFAYAARWPDPADLGGDMATVTAPAGRYQPALQVRRPAICALPLPAPPTTRPR